MMSEFLRRLQRAHAVYRELGFDELARRLGTQIRKSAGFGDPTQAAWSSRKMKRDAEFDSTYGTDTGGIQSLFGQEVVGDNAAHGLAHIATDPSEFEDAIKNLSIPFSQHTFIDIGCGKGRALILAAQHPFAAVVGVEFAPAFVEAARHNVATASSRGVLRSPVTIVLADATKFVFPDQPILLYMHNPFDSQILGQVALNIRASLRHKPRPFKILYSYPVYLDTLTNCGFQVITSGAGWVVLNCETASRP